MTILSACALRSALPAGRSTAGSVAAPRYLSSTSALCTSQASPPSSSSRGKHVSADIDASPSSPESAPAAASSPSTTAPTSSRPVSAPLVRESSSSPEAMNAQPLPYLSFALGLPTAPSDSEPTWSERKAVLLSQEHRMASRRSIVEQATRGYFHDFHAIKSHGGKTWRAPPTLIKSERALWFPRITGVRLSDKQKTNTISMTRNKVSVVAILNSKISEEHAKSFYQDTVSTFSSHPQFQLVLINLQENPLKSFMVSLFLSSLKQTLPENLHSTYILSSQNLELEKPLLGLHNKHVGYTYLVDQQGKIRWAGSAFAEQQEQSALKTCTAVLLERKAQPSQKKK